MKNGKNIGKENPENGKQIEKKTVKKTLQFLWRKTAWNLMLLKF